MLDDSRDDFQVRPGEMAERAREMKRWSSRKWIVALFLSVITISLLCHQGERYGSMLWGGDMILYRAVASGDTTWRSRFIETDIEVQTGFMYSDFQKNILLVPTTWGSEKTVIGVMFALNYLAALFMLTKLTEVRYGFWLAVIVGVKIYAWYAISGNIGLVGAALACWAIPFGPVLSTTIKPYGVLSLCVSVAHSTWEELAARTRAGHTVGQFVLACAGSPYVQTAISLVITLGCFAWSWFFWLSPSTRNWILP